MEVILVCIEFIGYKFDVCAVETSINNRSCSINKSSTNIVSYTDFIVDNFYFGTSQLSVIDNN